MIRVEVTEDVNGHWWVYLIQGSGIRDQASESRRIIGRRFASSVEAAAWGLNKAERYSAKEKE
jgi:hypothetical protein